MLRKKLSSVILSLKFFEIRFIFGKLELRKHNFYMYSNCKKGRINLSMFIVDLNLEQNSTFRHRFGANYVSIVY